MVAAGNQHLLFYHLAHPSKSSLAKEKHQLDEDRSDQQL